MNLLTLIGANASQDFLAALDAKRPPRRFLEQPGMPSGFVPYIDAWRGCHDATIDRDAHRADAHRERMERGE